MSIGLRCSDCGKELELIVSPAGLHPLSNEDVFTVSWICPNRRWYKPWHNAYTVTHFNDLLLTEKPLRFTAKQIYERYGVALNNYAPSY